MEISYKRNSNCNFMIIQCTHTENYELKMLCKNKIKGLLRADTNVFNGNCEIFYDISSRQPISRIYLKKEMEAEDIRTILLSIKILMEEVTKFLLDINNVLFAPDFCYCDLEDKKPEWVFYPGNEADSLSHMAEFIIDRVNHSDSRAVDAAYKFFKLVKDNAVSVAEIENILERLAFSEDCMEEVRPVAATIPRVVSAVAPKEVHLKSSEEKVSGYIKDKMMGLIKNVLKTNRNKATDTKICESKIQWETYGLEEPEAYAGETVVMGLNNRQQGHRLRNLREIGDFIALDKLPCIFGKLETCADVVLQDNSVSRVHAQIFEDKGDLYLQDLNSTNGSFVNSLAVENNEIVRLKSGDEIAFGNVRYIYE